MNNKVYYNERHIRTWINKIVYDVEITEFRPDYIVGLTRGGLIPAVMISQFLNIPMHTLKVSLRDDIDTESNCWMAEDALGYARMGKKETRKNILIVDDINDSGATLNWIKKDWKQGCFPGHPDWEKVWGNNVRTAVLINNEVSNFKNIDYIGYSINKEKNPEWCVFPWENWWE